MPTWYARAMRAIPAIAGFLCGMFLARSDAFCTTIIAMRGENQILVAADSKFTGVNGEKDSSGCKIHIVGGFVFASAGVLKVDKGSFNAEQIIRDSISDKISFKDDVNWIEGHIMHYMPEIAERILKSPDPIIQDWKVTGHQLFNLLVAKSDGGVLRVSTRDFSLARITPPYDIDSIDIKRKNCPGDQDCEEGMVTGMKDAVMKELDENKRFWQTHNPISGINRLIELQSVSTPNMVGMPVSIVEIQKNGMIDWLQRGMCVSSEGEQQK